MVRLDLEVFVLFLIEVKAWYILCHVMAKASYSLPDLKIHKPGTV